MIRFGRSISSSLISNNSINTNRLLYNSIIYKSTISPSTSLTSTLTSSSSLPSPSYYSTSSTTILHKNNNKFNKNYSQFNKVQQQTSSLIINSIFRLYSTAPPPPPPSPSNNDVKTTTIKAEVSTEPQDQEINITKHEVDPKKPKDPWSVTLKKMAKHYWLGTKLLGKNIGIAVRLVKLLSNGHSLSRSERNLLVQTSADVLRLVPFIIIMIIPFAELALPFLLKIFPNLLPSTYEWKDEKDEHLHKTQKGNISMTKFLQETLADISLELHENNIANAKEFHDFMIKVKQGEQVSGQEILKFSKLFRDEITMEKISRPQLVNMHKYLAGQSFVAKWYSNDYLKEQITKKLKKIKQDDILIKKEGVSSLTLEELVDAALVRGFKVNGCTRKQLENQLEQWLDLSLNKNVPPSLLILSRAFTLEKVPTESTQALEETLEHIPEEALNEVLKKLPDVFDDHSVERREEKLEALAEEEKELDVKVEEVVASKPDTTTTTTTTTTPETTTTTTTTATTTTTTTTTTETPSPSTPPTPSEPQPKLSPEAKAERLLNDDDDTEIHKEITPEQQHQQEQQQEQEQQQQQHQQQESPKQDQK